MADDPPYMPLYFGDILKLTLFWSGEERALLMLLLAVQWWHGPLPFDLLKLASAIKYDEQSFLALWNGHVHEVFTEREGGFIHEDTEARRRSVAKMSDARRAAGQASGKARRARPASLLEQTGDGLIEQNSEGDVRTKPRTNGSAYVRTSIQSNPNQSKQNQGPQFSEPHAAEGASSSPPLPSGADPPPPATANGPANTRAKPAPRSRRLPAGYAIEPWREWAAENTPSVNFDAEIAMLRDHEFRDAHSDWDAVVRNWLRRAAKQTKRSGEEHLTRYERHKRRLYGDA